MKNILSMYMSVNQRRSKLIILLVFISFGLMLNAVVINIPADQPTIQAGIDSSENGDTILVQPGTYYENINFDAKDITVASLYLTTEDATYVHSTIIDGNQDGSVVVFENDETNIAVLMGFTIQNGSGNESARGGGIFINHSSPSLKFLVVQDNQANTGGGIHISSSDAYLKAVTIKNNHAFSHSGGLAITRLAPNPVDSDVTFSSTHKCNIYNNTAGFAADIFIQYDHPEVDVIVDTFTVFNPDHNYVTSYPNLNLIIYNQWLEQVESDLFVSPLGDDDNSGLNENEPLRTIQWALTKIKADIDNPRNIYLAEGIYSPESNGEHFELNMRSYVKIIGAGIDETVLENPPLGVGFIVGNDDTDFSLSNFTVRNTSAEQMWDVAIPLRLSRHKSDIFKLRIENCESSSHSAIHSKGDLIMEDIYIINNRGTLPVALSKDFENDNHPNKILNNVVFIGNEPRNASEGGSGSLSISSAEYVRVTNCLFAQNSSYDSVWPKSLIHLDGNQTLDFFNNTVVDNSNTGGTISFTGGGTVNIKNSIIRKGNSQYLFQTRNNDVGPTIVNIEQSNIQGGTNPTIINIASTYEYPVEFNYGEGIIDEVSLFVGGDDEYDPLYYRLAEGSPGIDAGIADTTGLFIPPWDLLYKHRVWDGDNDGVARIDLGCYEYGAPEYVELGDPEIVIPTSIEISNYPNPFNPSTTISFSLTHSGQVELTVYNIKGQKVKSLIDCYMSPGRNDAIWNGRDDNNRQVASGTYFYKLIVNGDEVSTEKMILIK
jgi:hypothetical protein